MAKIPFLKPGTSIDSIDGNLPKAMLETERDGTHLVIGGLWFEPKTFQVRNNAGNPSGLYTLGATTQGQVPLYLGLWGIREGAARIVERILNEDNIKQVKN